jgi:serine/threonine-protein kinase
MAVSCGATRIDVGRYALYDVIGSGGMATVHLGRLVWDGGGGRIVAIKRLHPHLVADADVVRSFVDEARLAERIRHPNVVVTLDVVSKGGEVFLVMEYVDGASLGSLVRTLAARGESVPPTVAVAIVAAALRGLHAAHHAVNEAGEALNIVHRDVSPHNILVGVDGITRVLDFGVAKALGRQQTTRDGRIKGKLAYLAPEQLSGRGVTRRADVFAAGIVLWELLASCRLFQAHDDAETLTRVLFEPVRPPSQVCAGAPAELDRIVLQALVRDPTKRFATAEQMANALEATIAPATAAVIGEWVRRVAADELDARLRLVRDVERCPIAGDAEADLTDDPGGRTLAPTATTLSTFRDRRSVLAAAAIALTLATLGTAWSARAKLTGSRIASASTAPAPSMGPTQNMGEVASPSPVPSAATTIDAQLVAPTVGVGPQPARRTPASRAPKGTPAAKPINSARERLYSQD